MKSLLSKSFPILPTLLSAVTTGATSRLKRAVQPPQYEQPNPLAPAIAKARQALVNTNAEPTGLSREAYLETIAGIVSFFKEHQASDGRIIDPYGNKEKQYSTPCYAWAATVLIINGDNSQEMINSASQALSSALQQLATGQAADNHGDFFSFPALLAYEHLREWVSGSRRQQWETWLNNINPSRAYWGKEHGGSTNLDLGALTGEFLRYKHGFTTLDYVERHLEPQIPLFTAAGLYRDQPLTTFPYDNYARHLMSALLHLGYEGKHKAALNVLIDRSAWALLLMQSPWGEIPLGGRSCQHQWNEAQACSTLEIWAQRQKMKGDMRAAQAFKRAAHLALQSVRRWIRPSGELWIVKNRFNPKQRHGYEIYSWHSQYNLWAASALASAWLFADETIPEGTAPSDAGGFVTQLSSDFHKVFANAGGLYVEIDTNADKLYNSTGLLRLHKSGVEPLVSLSASSDVPSWKNPIKNTPLAVGIAWLNNNHWESLAQFGGGTFYSLLPRYWQALAQFGGGSVQSVTLNVEKETPQQVKFTVRYNLSWTKVKVKTVIETYEITPGRVRVMAKVDGNVERLKVRFPILTFDGERHTTICMEGATARVELENSQQVFQIESPKDVVLYRTNAQVYSRNGYLDIIEGEVQDERIIYTVMPIYQG